MKNISKYLVVQVGLFAAFYGYIVFAASLISDFPVEKSISSFSSSPVSLQEEDFEHIQFKRIKANNYIFHNHALKIEVDNSASFLMMPFEQVRRISQVSFQWRNIGAPDTKNEEYEKTRNGDDAVFKLALLLKADDALVNPLMPAWMKRVDKLLSLPSKEMIYLVVGAKHAAGQRWANPYNARVKMVAMKSSVDTNGWMKASYRFEQSVQVVGLWLMSDGDNTHSKFVTRVKNIVLE